MEKHVRDKHLTLLCTFFVLRYQNIFCIDDNAIIRKLEKSFKSHLPCLCNNLNIHDAHDKGAFCFTNNI